MLKNELKAYRIRKGYTQKQLARILDMGETSYTKRENGQIPFNADEINNLKEILELNDQDIIKIFFTQKVAFDATEKIDKKGA